MLRFTLIAALTMSIAACGGGGGDPGSGVTSFSATDETPDDDIVNQIVPVVYEGTSLIVRGFRYERRPGIALCSPIAICESGVLAYAPGQVIVFFKSDYASDANVLITYLGLSVRSMRTDSLIVNVPVLYERQWASALRQEPLFTAAEVNGLMRPA